MKAENAYSSGAKLCRPTPTFEFKRFPKNDGWILAISIWPTANQIVSIGISGDKNRSGHGGSAFVFPIRVGSHTDFIPPERLAMHMLPNVRRAAILLERIPEGTRVRVRAINQNDGNNCWIWTYTGVDEDKNLVNFSTDAQSVVNRPLDQVRTVFESEGEWHILFEYCWII